PPHQVQEEVPDRCGRGDDDRGVGDATGVHAATSWVGWVDDATTLTSPVLPSTTTSVPGANRRTASSTPTTVGTPSSRARIARCESTLPVSATRPRNPGSIGARLGSSVRTTSTAPSDGSA